MSSWWWQGIFIPSYSFLSVRRSVATWRKNLFFGQKIASPKFFQCLRFINGSGCHSLSVEEPPNYHMIITNVGVLFINPPPPQDFFFFLVLGRFFLGGNSDLRNDSLLFSYLWLYLWLILCFRILLRPASTSTTSSTRSTRSTSSSSNNNR